MDIALCKVWPLLILDQNHLPTFFTFTHSLIRLTLFLLIDYIKDVHVRLVQFDWKKSFRCCSESQVQLPPRKATLSGCRLPSRRLDLLESQSDHHAIDKQKGALAMWAELV